MRIRFTTKADRIARAEDQEKADKWTPFFAIWPRETKAGEYSFFCFLERCPTVIMKHRIEPNNGPGYRTVPSHKKITWRYRVPKKESHE